MTGSSPPVTSPAVGVTRFAQMSPEEFEGEVTRTWDTLKSYREETEMLVRNEHLTPVEGIRILAAISGILFESEVGYSQAGDLRVLAPPGSSSPS